MKTNPSVDRGNPTDGVRVCFLAEPYRLVMRELSSSLTAASRDQSKFGDAFADGVTHEFRGAVAAKFMH